jgi:hypothetical protein
MFWFGGFGLQLGGCSIGCWGLEEGQSARPMYHQFLYGPSKSCGSRSLHLAGQSSGLADFGLIRYCVKIFGFDLLRDKEGDYTEGTHDNHCVGMLSDADA